MWMWGFGGEGDGPPPPTLPRRKHRPYGSEGQHEADIGPPLTVSPLLTSASSWGGGEHLCGRAQGRTGGPKGCTRGRCSPGPRALPGQGSCDHTCPFLDSRASVNEGCVWAGEGREQRGGCSGRSRVGCGSLCPPPPPPPPHPRSQARLSWPDRDPSTHNCRPRATPPPARWLVSPSLESRQRE